MVILSSSLDGGTYDLYGVGKEQGEQDARRGQGSYPVWVARNRFAVLDKYGAIMIKNLKNETVKKLPVTGPTPERLSLQVCAVHNLALAHVCVLM